jgi:hypothetical protein
MRLIDAIALFREFPELRICDLDGEFDISSLFEDPETARLKLNKISKHFHLEGEEEDCLLVIKELIYEYIYELSQVYQDAKTEEPEIKVKPPSEYKQIIQIIKALARQGIQAGEYTIFDAYTMLQMDGKTVEQIQQEIIDKIEESRGHTQVRRKNIWDNWTEEQKQDRERLQHFLDSMIKKEI